MTRTFWSDGSQWAPATIPEATAFWSDGAETSGRPIVRVSIDSVWQRVIRASWRHGRPGWFADLEPTTATVTVRGAVTAEPGTLLIISSGADVHWKGFVQVVTTSERVGSDVTTTLTAVDAYGQSAGTEAAIAFDVSLMSVESMVEGAFAFFNLTPPVVEFASSTRTDSVVAGAFALDGTLGQMLQQIERSANAIIFFRTDGIATVLLRAAVDEVSVEVTPLDGDDAPTSWETIRDPSSIINHFLLVNSGGTVRLDAEVTASVTAYGRHTYHDDAYLYTVATHWTSGLRSAMAELRTQVPRATFKVHDYSQKVPWVLPLDFVSREETLYQVLQVEHDVSPEEWNVSLYLDSTQSAIEDETEPDPDDPPDDTVTVEEQTYTANRDTVVVRKDGNNLGAGEGDRLHVGYYSGAKARTLLHFPMTPSGAATGATGIRKATLRLKTSTQVDYAFGDNPKVVIERITEDWDEGNYAPSGGDDWSATNETVWPGPDTTTAGQVIKEITTAENTWTTYDVTDIARKHFTSGTTGGHGFRVRAVNEDWHGNATEFQSREGGSNDPELIVKWEVPV